MDVSIPTLYGYPYTKDYETKGQIEDISGVDLQTSFTVDVDTSSNLNATIDSDSSNGAQVQSIDVSPPERLSPYPFLIGARQPPDVHHGWSGCPVQPGRIP